MIMRTRNAASSDDDDDQEYEERRRRRKSSEIVRERESVYKALGEGNSLYPVMPFR